ncbi:MAG: 4Fe-4S binding protein [Synechococcaceae cyanobacterium]
MVASSVPFTSLADRCLSSRCHGIVGASRHAVRLRQAIRASQSQAANHPVLISGEAGLEKTNIAALIHFGSTACQQPLLMLEASQLQRRRGERTAAEAKDDVAQQNLLKELSGQGGSLLIKGVDQLEPALRQRLLSLATGGACGEEGAPAANGFQGRIYLTTDTPLPDVESRCTLIKVPPLRGRRQDLAAWVAFELRRLAPLLGWQIPPLVPQELLQSLLCEEWPGNNRELRQRIEMGLRRCAPQHPKQLPAGTFDAVADRLPRFDLWGWKPQLKRITRWSPSTNFVLQVVLALLFILFNLWLLRGPQQRTANGALVLFWGWWWPLIVLSYPLIGRLWCAFCPFMIWGDISQSLALRLGWQPRRWPRGDTDRWAAPLMAAGFAAILLWEELADLPNTAWLSSCLLLLITAGAVIGSLLFEKRFWCRFLCPVGGMNGLFAKLSMSELRARLGVCSGSCSDYFCCKGDPGQSMLRGRTGCPEGYHPGHLGDNRNCVMCLTCASVCPHGSVQLRLRPPGTDLQPQMQPPAGEAGLILVLAGGIVLHHWRSLLGWCSLAPESLQNGPLLPRLAFALAALALPAAAWLLLRGAWSLGRRWQRRRSSEVTSNPMEVKPAQQWLLLYALLPLLWSLLLDSHLDMGMAEAGLLLPRSLGAIGLAAPPELLAWSADPHVIGFSQSLILLIGTGGSIVLLRRLLRPDGLGWLLLSSLAVGLGLGGRLLLAG